MSVTKILIGPQQEMISQIGFLRMANFMEWNITLIWLGILGRLFISLVDIWSLFWKTNWNEWPSKRVNGQLHRIKHDILTRSYKTRQFP